MKIINRDEFQFSRQLPDFQVQTKLSKQVEITEEMAKERHPLEWITSERR